MGLLYGMVVFMFMNGESAFAWNVERSFENDPFTKSNDAERTTSTKRLNWDWEASPLPTTLCHVVLLKSYCGWVLPIQPFVQKCRKICGLGCVNCERARSWVTQPSPHIFLHICVVVAMLCTSPILQVYVWTSQGNKLFLFQSNLRERARFTTDDAALHNASNMNIHLFFLFLAYSNTR